MNNKYNEKLSRSRRHKRKKSSWPVFIFLLLAFFLAVAAGALYAKFLSPDADSEVGEQAMSVHDKTIIMLMGVDQREGDVGRSDTLMLASLDPKKNNASLLSIPRDTRVKIPGFGFDKINAAYAYGGHKLTQRTMENLLGIKMEHYVLIDVKAFQKIIDALGGIEINVEKRMYYEDPWDDDGGLLIDLRPGPQHMDGKTAITYVRYRDEEGDIGRIGRQQKFMQAVLDKLTSPTIIPKIPNIIREVVSSIKTDLSLTQMIELATALNSARDKGLKTEMLPGKPVYIEGISYWIPDLAKLPATIANTLDIRMSPSVINALEKENRVYERSLPDNVEEIPVREETLKNTKNNAKENTKETKKKDTAGKDKGDKTTKIEDRKRPEPKVNIEVTEDEDSRKDESPEDSNTPVTPALVPTPGLNNASGKTAN